jgi:Holliday junction DNA helicase RuvA
MISLLQGRVIEKLPQTIIIDVRGVGYEVRVTPRLWQQAHSDMDIVVYTHFHVREDAQVLFGFVDLRERDMFRTLLTVNSVGPKIAMAVLSVAAPDDIVRAVQNEDVSALKAPGVGPKIVKRLIAELKAVFGELSLLTPKGAHVVTTAHAEAASALLQLGYTEQEVRAMMDGIDTSDMTVQEVIKRVLAKRV